MADISASVGNGGKNLDNDVQTVQILLNQAPVSKGGPNPPIDIDGWCGPATNKAILAFQRAQQLPVQDGRVDPGKNTIRRLNEAAEGPGARTVPLPDLDPSELARQSVPLVSLWGNAGLSAVNNALNSVRANSGLSGVSAVVRTALAGHFKITDALSRSQMESALQTVAQNYSNALGVVARNFSTFRTVGRRQMNSDFNGQPGAPAYVLPANRTFINFSPLFHSRSSGSRPGLDWTGDGFGPKCRAAMVLHEPIHVVDSRGGHDIYEHGPGYLTMSLDQAIHNAASYPSFGAHVFENSSEPLGPLYGAGKPAI